MADNPDRFISPAKIQVEAPARRPPSAALRCGPGLAPCHFMQKSVDSNRSASRTDVRRSPRRPVFVKVNEREHVLCETDCWSRGSCKTPLSWGTGCTIACRSVDSVPERCAPPKSIPERGIALRCHRRGLMQRTRHGRKPAGLIQRLETRGTQTCSWRIRISFFQETSEIINEEGAISSIVSTPAAVPLVSPTGDRCWRLFRSSPGLSIRVYRCRRPTEGTILIAGLDASAPVACGLNFRRDQTERFCYIACALTSYSRLPAACQLWVQVGDPR